MLGLVGMVVGLLGLGIVVIVGRKLEISEKSSLVAMASMRREKKKTESRDSEGAAKREHSRLGGSISFRRSSFPHCSKTSPTAATAPPWQ